MNLFSIIVIYNGMRNNWIEKCFNSLLTSTYSTKIIAVDNASNDGSVDFIKKNYPHIELIESSENLGFGGANNLGISSALKQGAQYFLLNQDAWVEPSTLNQLINFSKEHPAYGIISPLHLDGNGEGLDRSFARSVSPYFCEDFLSDLALSKPLKDIYPIDFICAAAWLVTKKCIEKVGGFSPTFFHYGEDDNFCHRMKYKKIGLGFLPSAKIFHDRKDRAKNKFAQRVETEKRQMLLSASNPNKPIDIQILIKQYRNKVIKNKLLFDKKELKINKEILSYLKKNSAILTSNLKKSMASTNYLFLD